MKNNPILSSMINFLLPIIFIYGLFFLAGFFDSGFFAFIYSLVLFVSALMIFYVANNDLPIFTKINLEYVALFVVLLSIAYVSSLLFFITDFFSL